MATASTQYSSKCLFALIFLFHAAAVAAIRSALALQEREGCRTSMCKVTSAYQMAVHPRLRDTGYSSKHSKLVMKSILGSRPTSAAPTDMLNTMKMVSELLGKMKEIQEKIGNMECTVTDGDGEDAIKLTYSISGEPKNVELASDTVLRDRHVLERRLASAMKRGWALANEKQQEEYAKLFEQLGLPIADIKKMFGSIDFPGMLL